MKRFLDVFLAIVVSPELLFIAGFALLVYLKPNIFISLASAMNTANDPVQYFPLIPVAIVIVLVFRKDDLLFPEERGLNKLLQDWPQYHRLLDRYMISVFWAILCSAFTLTAWMFKRDLTEYITFSFF